MKRFKKLIQKSAGEFATKLANDVVAEMLQSFTLDAEPKVRRKRGPNKKKGAVGLAVVDEGEDISSPPVKKTRHYRKNPVTGGLEVKVDGQPAVPVGDGE